MQVIFATKVKNKGKLDSHCWFFDGLAYMLQPEYCILFDAGEVPCWFSCCVVGGSCYLCGASCSACPARMPYNACAPVPPAVHAVALYNVYSRVECLGANEVALAVWLRGGVAFLMQARAHCHTRSRTSAFTSTATPW